MQPRLLAGENIRTSLEQRADSQVAEVKASKRAQVVRTDSSIA